MLKEQKAASEKIALQKAKQKEQLLKEIEADGADNIALDDKIINVQLSDGMMRVSPKIKGKNKQDTLTIASPKSIK